MRPAAAAALLAGLAAAALLANGLVAVAVLAAVLLASCLRAPRSRRRVYLTWILLSAGMLFVLSPLLSSTGSHVLWSGPIVPVLGSIDVTTEEIRIAAVQALRLAAVSLAFACFALLLDHDRLLTAAGGLRRFGLVVGLAARLTPTLERDAAGLVESLRGRGIEVHGIRGYGALASPLLAGSLERGLNLAEAMEARGFGRPGRTSTPAPGWSALDLAAVAAGIAAVVAGALWL